MKTTMDVQKTYVYKNYYCIGNTCQYWQIMNLEPELLSQREVDSIDIAVDTLSSEASTGIPEVCSLVHSYKYLHVRTA